MTMTLASRLRRRLRRMFGLPNPMETLAGRYPQYAIGRGSYGGLEIAAYPGDANLVMGAFCSVAADVTVLLGGEHRPDWVTTYPFNETCAEARHITGHPHTRGDVVIGNDVWIGRNAMILSGVTIGDGAVIGARALVRSHVPPYGIVAGNPAQLVRKRFPDDIIARLLAIAWWDWPDERIRRALPLLLDSDIAGFLDAAEAGRI